MNEVAIKQARKSWPTDRRILRISSAPVRNAVLSILVDLSFDPKTLRRLTSEPAAAIYKIEVALLSANRLSAQQYEDAIRKAMERIIDEQPRSLTHEESDGFVTVTYTP